jgi:hypothetical protein
VVPFYPNKVNPDTFMITMDIPVERFISLMTNQSSEYINRPVKVIAQKQQTATSVGLKQTASVISAIEDGSSKSGFVVKIREGIKNLFIGLFGY